MRGPLIAKDNPPCGAGRKFPRAPTISNDETMQPVIERDGEKRRDETGAEGLPGTNREERRSIWTHQDGNI